ncbi:MAG: DUF2203 domain-containing protein [Elusimicrobia bacterium]|nr:DUF2203 domain-containing protein [Elusimicrobiota bacterium]
MKYFQLEEAEALIPDLEKIFKVILEGATKATAKVKALEKREVQGKASPAELAIEKAQLQFLVNVVNDSFQKILDLGAYPKGLDPALVDFPCRLGGKEVYLCWEVGEKRITHYHGLEEGFDGRKALPRPLMH